MTDQSATPPAVKPGVSWADFSLAATERRIVRWQRSGIVERLARCGHWVYCQNADSLEVHAIRPFNRVMKCEIIEGDEARAIAEGMDQRIAAVRATLRRGQIVRVKALWYTRHGLMCWLPEGFLVFNPYARLTREVLKSPAEYREIVKPGDEFDAKVKVVRSEGVIVSRRSLFPKPPGAKPKPPAKAHRLPKKPVPVVEKKSVKPAPAAAPPAPLSTPAAKPRVRHIIRG